MAEKKETAAPAAKKPPFAVSAKVRSLTTLAGVKVAGEEVTANMFTGGKERLDALVESGVVVKG